MTKLSSIYFLLIFLKKNQLHRFIAPKIPCITNFVKIIVAVSEIQILYLRITRFLALDRQVIKTMLKYEFKANIRRRIITKLQRVGSIQRKIACSDNTLSATQCRKCALTYASGETVSISVIYMIIHKTAVFKNALFIFVTRKTF